MTRFTELKSIGVLLLLLVLSACNRQEEVKQPVVVMPDCGFPDAPTATAPGWVCGEPVAGVVFSAVGGTVKSAAGHSFMEKMASTDARAQLVEAMKLHVQARVKQYAETSAVDSATVDKLNASLAKQINDAAVMNAEVVKSTASPKGNLYVLLAMNASLAATATEKVLKTSIEKNSDLWQPLMGQTEAEALASAIANVKP